MSSPTPLQAFLGGISLIVPAHSLLLLNGNVFGISGFIHNAIRGQREAVAAVTGLISGGVVVALTEGAVTSSIIPTTLVQTSLAGLLVGFGSKLSNGCTSGHMLCGISRLSIRSIVATATFFATGVITTHLLHGNLPPIGTYDWSLGSTGKALILLQTIPFAISTALYLLTSPPTHDKIESPSTESGDDETSPHPISRLLASFSTAVQFALALRLSSLVIPARVLGFLLLPPHTAFDPSLAFLAAGALPFGISLYHFARGNEKPRLGGSWSIPSAGEIDTKLIFGAAIFGVGWGIAGICPGPGLVNFGRALVHGTDLIQTATWLSTAALGGLLASF